MYVALKKTLTKLSPEKILAVAQNFQDSFAFEAPNPKKQFFSFGAIEQLVPPQVERSIPTVSTWYYQCQKKIPANAKEAIRMVGGFAFESQTTAQKNIWGPFQTGRFFLPKYTLIQTDTTTYDLWILAEDREHCQKDAILLEDQLKSATPLTMINHRLKNKTELAVDQWQQNVAQLVTHLQNGTLKKVVMARPLQLQSDTTFAGEQAWLQLKDKNPETYHLLYRHKTTAFISATPEHLIRVDHQKFHTVAIAGTCPTGQTPAETKILGLALFHDSKNRQEQNFVTQTIIENLQKLKAELHYPKEPALLVNKNVQHLCTPIWGHLSTDTTPFQLIQYLHPTPALGGIPKDQAQTLIAKFEPLARGLFGGPIGYLNFAQQGEFVVGIRSSLLQETQATLFAGAGIVSDSDPAQEVAETRLKFQPMLQTLLNKGDL